MHLSAAAGAPTLGLFGPSDDRRYGPWGLNARTLRGPRDFETFKRLDPDLNQAVCHMFDLPIPWVVKAARTLLQDTEPSFTPAGLPQPGRPVVVVGVDAPTQGAAPSDPSSLFTAPFKTPRKTRAKAAPAQAEAAHEVQSESGSELDNKLQPEMQSFAEAGREAAGEAEEDADGDV
jgi:hypothetical protein